METDGRQYQAGEDMDARARVKRLEAEYERLRESVQKYADNVCEGWCATNGGQGKFKDCQGCQIYNLATPPPEGEPDQSPLSAWVHSDNREEVGERVAERAAQRQEAMMGDAGDALDALINRVVPALDEMSDLEETQYPAEAALYHDRNRIRQELRDELRAASGVPYVPDRARNIVEAVCAKLTFAGWRTAESRDRIMSWMSELRNIHTSVLSSVPTALSVPEEVRRLPERMRENAAIRKDQAASIAQGDEEKRAYIRGQANAVKHWAEQVEAALASAPADGNFITRKEAFQAWSALDKQDLTKAKAILAEALEATAPTDGRE